MAWKISSLEAVLEKHGVCVCGLHNYVVLKRRSELSHYPGLLDDLLALVPQPQREALDALWAKHDHRYGSAEAWREAVKDDLMAWAIGQRMKPTWCKHMIWKDDDAHLRGWHYVQFQESMLEESWVQCPVKHCGAKRPESP